MDKKRNACKWIVLIIVLVAIGTASFLFGQYLSDSKHKAEKELDYKLNLCELDGLGAVSGTIYVTGHKSPDSDTVGSSIAYAALLQKLGYDAVPVVLGDINKETRYVLETGGIDTPKLLEDASGCNMVLVDHSEYVQSAEGLKNANVLTIIDHHGDGSVSTGNQLIYDARPLGSTATIIWIRYRNYGVEVDPQVAHAMVGSILSDTGNLQYTTTTFADREALKELSLLAGISDLDAFYQQMVQASSSYEGMTDEEIFFSDYKEYEHGEKKFSIGCIDACDEDGAKVMVERMAKTLPGAVASTGVDMSFAQISLHYDDVSATLLVPANEASDEVLRTAFGENAIYDGTSYRLEPSISRKQTLVPAITEVLDSY